MLRCLSVWDACSLGQSVWLQVKCDLVAPVSYVQAMSPWDQSRRCVWREIGRCMEGGRQVYGGRQAGIWREAGRLSDIALPLVKVACSLAEWNGQSKLNPLKCAPPTRPGMCPLPINFSEK